MILMSLKRFLKLKNGFISAHWDGSSETENKIKDMTKATIRCIPYDNKVENGRCVLSGTSIKTTCFVRKSLLNENFVKKT